MSNTEIKTIKYGEIEVAKNDYNARAQAIESWFAESSEKVASKYRAYRAQLVADMQADTEANLDNVEIGAILGVSKGEVGKLGAAGYASKLGFDINATLDAINDKDSAVSVGAINRIKKSKQDKVDKSDELLRLGATEKGARAPKTPKTREQLTAQAVAMINKIVEQANEGKLAQVTIANAIWEANETLSNIKANATK
jgi:hypothetical protein